MHPNLKLAYDNEITLARELYQLGALETAFGHLENAHIFGAILYLGAHPFSLLDVNNWYAASQRK
jgi:hypothetical protein